MVSTSLKRNIQTAKSGVIRPTRLLALMCIGISLLSRGVFAQQASFKQMQADPKHSTWAKVKISDDRKVIDNMLKGSVPLSQAEFDLFFTKVVFPQFTLNENIFYKTASVGGKPPNYICMLPQMRRDFKEFYKNSDKQARDRLNALALTELMKIVRDNYHPVARYNAAALVADLNDSDAPEVPYRPALTELGRTVLDNNLPEAIRIAALIGIVRHAKAGVDGPVAANMVGFLSTLAGAKEPPKGTSIEGHDWMRRRAIDALVALHTKQAPKDGQFFNLLSNILQDASSSVELRATAIEAMLTVKSPLPEKWPSEKLADAMAMVAVDATKRELTVSDQRGRPVSTDPGIKYYATCTQRGLAALNALAATPKVAQFDPLVAALLALVGKESPPVSLGGESGIAPPVMIYEQLAEASAKIESLATGKPVSSILPKVAPVGGTAAVGPANGGEGRVRIPRGGGGANLDR